MHAAWQVTRTVPGSVTGPSRASSSMSCRHLGLPTVGRHFSLRFCCNAASSRDASSGAVFPMDLNYDMSCLFLQLRNPKTARFARRQHGQIDDQFVIQIAENLFFHLPLQARLYPGTAYSFKRQWDQVMTRLGIPCKQSQKGGHARRAPWQWSHLPLRCLRRYSMDCLAWPLGPHQDLGVLSPRGGGPTDSSA